MTVQPLGPDHHSQWLPLWRGYQAFYNFDVPAETEAIIWSRLLDPAEPMKGALCWDGDRATGLVHWVTHRSFRTVGDYIYLADLFVDPAVRGGGTGRKLIEHVYDVARVAGCARVWWQTHETNATAMRLYDQVAEKSGFLQYRKAIG